MKREVDADTFRGKGKQVSLGESVDCTADHKRMAIEYGCIECPSCGRKTAGQMRLSDYE